MSRADGVGSKSVSSLIAGVGSPVGAWEDGACKSLAMCNNSSVWNYAKCYEYCCHVMAQYI